MGIPFPLVYVGIAAYTITRSSIAMFFLLSIIATILKIVYRLVIYPDYFSSIGHIPSPSKRSFLTGSSASYLIESPFEEMRSWIEQIPNNGLVRYYIVGNLERVLLTSPKVLSELLVHKVYDFPKPEIIRASLAPVTGDHGLLLVEGDEHKKQRKNLMPAFSYRHIKELYPTFWAKSTELANCIEADLKSRPNSADNVICVGPWASRATLDIIGVAGMNHDFNSLKDPDNDLSVQYQKIFNDPPLTTKLLYVLSMILGNPGLVNKLPLKSNREMSEGCTMIRNIARRIIREKKETPQADTTDTASVDIISAALQSGHFTDEDLVDQMMTFLAAGHETTSTALQWAIYALCKHPHTQTRLRQEIHSHIPSATTEITASTLDSLPYLHAFCNELLRFHPSVPATVRTADRDTTLVNTPIPKGTLFLIAPEIINRSKEFWGPDANTFNPDRWMGAGKANTGGASSNYAFLSFLHGPRSCIGQGFAKAELACLVAALVGRFEVELEEPEKELVVRKSATVCPMDGVLARFRGVEW